jgi:hypothetical protein
MKDVADKKPGKWALPIDHLAISYLPQRLHGSRSLGSVELVSSW